MSPTILLLLACATICFSIPFPSSVTKSVVASHVATAAKQVLTHQLSDRESLKLSPSDRQGVNFSPCTSNTDCLGGRLCVTATEAEIQVCPTDCICAPTDPQDLFCTSQSDCDSGEVCAAIEGSNLCFDEQRAPPGTSVGSPTVTSPTTPTTATTGTATAATTGTGPTTTSTLGNADSPAASGVTLDLCRDAEDCRGSRDCLNSDDEEFCDGDGCRCLPSSITPCANDSECDDGESCFLAADILNVLDFPFSPESGREVRLCASRAAVQALSGDRVCIGAHSLGHISREELVFEKHAIARVLCDVNNSCATPGHIVQYKGKGMMMKSYCELTGCTRKIMLVNSPKYRRGLTVASSTEDLVFTALAARFESRAEEGVLSAAVRLGF